MASGWKGTLYIGMTNDLVRRVWQHKSHIIEGFTEKNDVTELVWFESHQCVEEAIKREKRLKRYKRDWKIRLIETDNPKWIDLYQDIAHP